MDGLPEALQRTLAGRYRIARELGAGGMAMVYLATDLRHERPVALKVLRPELASTLGAERFLHEIRTTARLSHPHILPLLDSGRADGTLYYIMPYVEGESLQVRLAREKQLPLDESVQIAQEVAGALWYAHSHGVIHRDIKPGNILLQSGHAVVADFGIARAVSAAGGTQLTESGFAVGTPAYMSPEQAAGDPELDGRSDIYSLGCVLWEMLSGETPYTGPTPQAILAKKLSEPLPRISVVRQTVPPGMEAALEKALARAPADRFGTAAAFAAALANAQTAGAAVPAGARPWWSRRSLRAAVSLLLVAALAVVLTLGRRLPPGPSAAGHPRTAIAVLPFENLSAQGPYAYLASGLHDELLTQLAKVAGLTVMARTSVVAYAGTTKPLHQIADELGVGSVVEGSVQVAGNRLHFNVQLIDPRTAAHVWAETYDSTLEDVFAVESDIAQRVVAAVGLTLAVGEQQALTAAPTRSADAFQLYLQGLEYLRRPGYLPQNLEAAQHLFERAVALDSAFALAHAQLAVTHSHIYFLRTDPSVARGRSAEREAQIALRLAPSLPQARLATGSVYYYVRRDYRRALKEFDLAVRGLPSDAEVQAALSFVHRRLGQFDEALAAFRRAVRLDPRNATLWFDNGGNTLIAMGRYAEAIEVRRHGLILAPDYPNGRWAIARTYALWKGDLDSLRAIWNAMDARVRASSWRWGVELLLWERQPDSLLALLRQEPQDWDRGQSFYRPTVLYAAWAHQLRRDAAAAKAAFDSALTLLDSVMRGLPDDWRVHAARGQALAGLGRRREALREAQWLADLPRYRDRYGVNDIVEERAQILARSGDRDHALGEIERLLAGPAGASAHTLRLDPRWDPIRDDPRFQALLVRYAHSGAG